MVRARVASSTVLHFAEKPVPHFQHSGVSCSGVIVVLPLRVYSQEQLCMTSATEWISSSKSVLRRKGSSMLARPARIHATVIPAPAFSVEEFRPARTRCPVRGSGREQLGCIDTAHSYGERSWGVTLNERHIRDNAGDDSHRESRNIQTCAQPRQTVYGTVYWSSELSRRVSTSV